MKRTLVIATLFLAVFAWVIPTDALAQRRGGGSFGGSRGGGYGRSFGRSYRSPSSCRSFGGSRSRQTPPPSRNAPGAASPSGRFNSSPSARNSFGGARMNRQGDYTGRYGVPRATERRAFRDPSGTQTNYVVNRYGGMGDGFMMGYMLGSIPWYWSMPFHPAFYFSRPYTHANPDGSVAVYPPTFQWGTLIITLLVIGAIAFILFTWLRNRRRRLRGAFAGTTTRSTSWDGGESDDTDSKSSFY